MIGALEGTTPAQAVASEPSTEGKIHNVDIIIIWLLALGVGGGTTAKGAGVTAAALALG